jgi:exodeoxyribonuclease VII large subunit
VPDVTEELAKVLDARGRIQTRVTTYISGEWEKLEQLRSRPVLATSEWIISSRAEDVIRHVQRGSDLVERRLDRAAAETQQLRAQLRALSPQQTLDRGYAIAVRKDGLIVRAASDAPAKTSFVLTLADGAIDALSNGPRSVES